MYSAVFMNVVLSQARYFNLHSFNRTLIILDIGWDAGFNNDYFG